MEPIEKKRKDNKPVFLLLGFILFFILIIYFITRKSLESKAIDKVQLCLNINDVKIVFDNYKDELLESSEDGKPVISSTFIYAVRNKLNEFNLTNQEIKFCNTWLPQAPTSINLIVIPDLSRRIIDTVNNPKQVENDILILKSIWSNFLEATKLKINSKDRLIIDVTDIDQANGQFSEFANRLQFDLSRHVGKTNRLFFTPDKDSQYIKDVTEMYKSAKSKPLGADYRFYFRRYLKNHFKENTIFDNFKNKIVIITDGYLEAEGKPVDTKIYGYERVLHQAVLDGNVLDVISSNALNIPAEKSINLSDCEILVCEVNERKFKPFTSIVSTGQQFDYEILKVYWEDWFFRMNAEKNNVFIVQREQASNSTAEKLKQFIFR
jgi:hypothetical protein